MAFDEGPSPEQAKPRSAYEQSVVGLVDKTLNLWGRKLPQYIIMVGLTGVAIVVFQTIILLAMFGVSGYYLLEFIGTSPLDSVFSLLMYQFTIEYLLVIFSLSTLGLVIYAIVAGGAIHYALTDYENPGSGAIGESLSFAANHAIPLIGVQLLQSLIIVGLAVLSSLVSFDILIYLAMTILILYISVRLAPAQAIVIAEERSPVNALKRSWQVTGGLFWHVFFGQLLIGIVVVIIDFGVIFVLGLILPFIVADVLMVIFVITSVSSLAISSISYIYLAVLYKDLEARGTAGDFSWWQ